MLLACLRFLAECPCPLCYVKKKDISALGTLCDMQQREKSPRIDTEAIQFDIELTRSWIFHDGLSGNSRSIAKVLGMRSLLPVRVGCPRGHLLST